MFKLKSKVTALLLTCAILGLSSPYALAKAQSKTPTVAQTKEEQLTRQQLADAQIMGLLWMRSSAEYRALCYQGYNVAMSAIDAALAHKDEIAKPLAIVLDCDETVTDNTLAMAQDAKYGNGKYTGLWWRNVVGQGKATAMPGARDFLKEVASKGVAIFYVTNRYAKYNLEITLKSLAKLGFPQVDEEHVLLMTDLRRSDKQLRFDKIAEKYHIIVYMGDNCGDLPLATKGKTLAQRNAIIDGNKAHFGTKYIVFPNPAYGAWVSALSKKFLTLPPNEWKKLVAQALVAQY